MMTLKRILVPTDFGEAARTALSYGRALAQAFGASLDVLHVTQDMFASSLGVEMANGPVVLDVQREVDAYARKELERLVGSEGAGPPTKSVILTSNAPAALIVQYAKNKQIDLIVMGTHGRQAIEHVLMGSVAEKVVRTAPCPVLSSLWPTRWPPRPRPDSTRTKPCALPPLRPPRSMHPPTVR
jgi:nucleotide-binding universal stress UspA family protein